MNRPYLGFLQFNCPENSAKRSAFESYLLGGVILQIERTFITVKIKKTGFFMPNANAHLPPSNAALLALPKDTA